MIYLDNNATTRVFDCVVEAMLPFFTDNYANSASAIGHFTGIPQIVASNKNRISTALGADNGDQFVITSGATESNNLAIFGAARANPHRNHLVASAIEHPSVMEPFEALRTRGYDISILEVDSEGLVDMNSLTNVLSNNTLLVSIMLANNETGVIQPIQEIAELVKQYNPQILLHTDATQAVGKIPIQLDADFEDVDLLSFSAHKFHGPKAVGSLFVRNPDYIAAILFGGQQQGGTRPGTENVAGVVGMATALTTLLSKQSAMLSVGRLRDFLESKLLASYNGAFALSSSAPRLPTTLNVCLPGVSSANLVDRLAAQGIAVSSGSACAHGAQKPSYVASALGLAYELAESCLRLSLSVETTREEIATFLAVLGETVPRIAFKHLEDR